MAGEPLDLAPDALTRPLDGLPPSVEGAFTEEATQPFANFDLEEGALAEGYLEDSTDRLELDELDEANLQELSGDLLHAVESANALPEVLPWSLEGALTDENGRRVQVRLAPELSTSIWRGGPEGNSVQTRLELQESRLLVQLRVEPGVPEVILLGRDVLSGRVLISC